MKYSLMDSIAGEVAYLPVVHYNWPNASYRAMKPLIPPALTARLNNPRTLDTVEITAAVEADPTPCSDPRHWQRLLTAALPEVEAFLCRFDTGVWFEEIALHVTRYGTGGSYHLPGMSMFPAPTVTIRDPSIGHAPRTFLECVLHESIHLLLEERVVGAHGLSQEAKEALVDKLCICNEVMLMTGRRYPPQSSYAPHLPANWATLVTWNAGQQPSW